MKIFNIFFVILGILGLVGVRGIEDKLFYDPFLEYFKEANPSAVFPKLIWSKLILHHLFRFSLNLFFSGLVFHFLFRNKRWTAQALVLFILFFSIAFAVYLVAIYTKFSVGYVFSFYTRRFVIQPLVLLLIIPIFYYRKHLEKQA